MPDPKSEPVPTPISQPTVERAYALCGAVVAKDAELTEEKRRDAIKTKLVEAQKTVSESFEAFEGGAVSDAAQLAQHVLMADVLKRPLPAIDDLDFSDKDAAKRKIAEKLEFLPRADADKKYNEMYDAYLEWCLLRYAADATEAVDVVEDNDGYYDKVAKRLVTEDYLKAIASKGVADKTFKEKLSEEKKKDREGSFDAFLKKNAHKVQDGLYARKDEDGDTLFILSELTPENIQRVIDEKKHKKGGIVWNNIPKKAKKSIELACLQQGKKVLFNDGKGPKETELSKLMPEPPGDWHKWAENINAKQWKQKMPIPTAASKRSKLMRDLVQGVVGDHPKRLREFWDDLSQKASPEVLAAAKEHLTEEQKGILQVQYTAKLNDAVKGLEATPPPSKATQARLEAELVSVRRGILSLAEDGSAKLKEILEQHVVDLTEIHELAQDLENKADKALVKEIDALASKAPSKSLGAYLDAQKELVLAKAKLMQRELELIKIHTQLKEEKQKEEPEQDKSKIEQLERSMEEKSGEVDSAKKEVAGLVSKIEVAKKQIEM
jgi:hypothetical protein